MLACSSSGLASSLAFILSRSMDITYYPFDLRRFPMRTTYCNSYLFHWIDSCDRGPGPVNVPEKCVMYLAPARGATTCHARQRPKCSGTPCGCQDNSQTLETREKIGKTIDKAKLGNYTNS